MSDFQSAYDNILADLNRHSAVDHASAVAALGAVFVTVITQLYPRDPDMVEALILKVWETVEEVVQGGVSGQDSMPENSIYISSSDTIQ